MRYLIDTHVLIWFLEGNILPNKVEALIEDKTNSIYISIASLWEIAIKYNLGKIQINGGFDALKKLLIEYDIEVLAITLSHINYILDLPQIHRDPFDRMIIAEALIENLPIISKDGVFGNYPVEIIW